MSVRHGGIGAEAASKAKRLYFINAETLVIHICYSFQFRIEINQRMAPTWVSGTKHSHAYWDYSVKSIKRNVDIRVSRTSPLCGCAHNSYVATLIHLSEKEAMANATSMAGRYFNKIQPRICKTCARIETKMARERLAGKAQDD